MAKTIVNIFAVLTLLLCAGKVVAQDLDGSALAACPAYQKNSPIISDIAWSVNCLLQAIHDGNKGIIAELSAYAACDQPPCDGPLDAYISELIFGVNGSGKTESGLDALSVKLAKAKWLAIEYVPQGEDVEVRIIPRPGKAKVTVQAGFQRDFFATDFRFDPKRSIWAIYGNFFWYETDIYYQFDYNYPDGYRHEVGPDGPLTGSDRVIDLTGSKAVLPVMIWKPKK